VYSNNFATKKFNPLLFRPISKGLTQVEHFQQLERRNKISSVTNECENVMSFSILFASGGEIMK
jgi:hypothetical protein